MIGRGVQQLLQNNTANPVSITGRSFLKLESPVLRNELAYNSSAVALPSLE